MGSIRCHRAQRKHLVLRGGLRPNGSHGAVPTDDHVPLLPGVVEVDLFKCLNLVLDGLELGFGLHKLVEGFLELLALHNNNGKRVIRPLNNGPIIDSIPRYR